MSEVTYAHHGKVVLGLPDIAPTLAQGAAVRRGRFQALPSRRDNAIMSVTVHVGQTTMLLLGVSSHLLEARKAPPRPVELHRKRLLLQHCYDGYHRFDETRTLGTLRAKSVYLSSMSKLGRLWPSPESIMICELVVVRGWGG